MTLTDLEKVEAILVSLATRLKQVEELRAKLRANKKARMMREAMRSMGDHV